MDFYIEKLQNTLAERKHKNKTYSLRAFARDLGIHPSSLSAILRKRRVFPKTYIAQVCQQLKLSPNEKRQFAQSIKSVQDWQALGDTEFLETKKTLEEHLHYRIITEWEYFALLTLIETSDFVASELWIARRLNLSLTRVRDILEHLEKLKFIKMHKGAIELNQTGGLTTTDDILSRALRKAHTIELELALSKIESIPTELRDFSSNFIAINPKNILKAKKHIREFRRNMEQLLEKGAKKEVYLLSIQLFPITEIKAISNHKSKNVEAKP
jgi:uncharacterized protein (TIGR02147 family)